MRDQGSRVFRQIDTGRSPNHERLGVFIGKWINEGHMVDTHGQKGVAILTSDVYEWMPGRFFVLHTAYGRIGDLDVGGTEILAYDPATKAYSSLFFDSGGNIHRATLTVDGDSWTWKGDTTSCTAVFTDGGRVQTAHHIRLDEGGRWIPSMEVVLIKVK